MKNVITLLVCLSIIVRAQNIRTDFSPFKLNEQQTLQLFNKEFPHQLMSQFTYCDYHFATNLLSEYLKKNYGFSKSDHNDKGIPGILQIDEFTDSSRHLIVLKSQVFDNNGHTIIKNFEITAPDSIITSLLRNYWLSTDSLTYKYVFKNFQDEITYTKSFKSKLVFSNFEIKSMAVYADKMQMNIDYSSDAYFAEKYKNVKITEDKSNETPITQSEFTPKVVDLKTYNRNLFDSLQAVIDKVVKIHALALDDANFQIKGDYSINVDTDRNASFDMSEVQNDSKYQLNELLATLKEKVIFPKLYINGNSVSYKFLQDVDIAMRFGVYTFDIGASGGCEFPDPKPCTELWSVIEENYRNKPKGSYDVKFKYTAFNQRILDSEISTLSFAKKRVSSFRNLYIAPLGF